MKFAKLRHSLALSRRRVLLPICVLVYGCGALACLAQTLGPGDGLIDLGLSGYGLVVALALAGHFVAALAIVIQCCLGGFLLTRLGWQRELASPGEGILFSWVVGFVLSSFALQLLAWAGILNGATIAMTIGGAGASAGVALHRGAWLRLPGPPESRETADWHSLLPAIAAVFVWIAWASPLLVQTALPNTDWDSALYHLPLAERYLAGDLWNSDPLFSAYSFPGAVSLVYAGFMGLGFESAIIPYNFLGVLLGLLAVHALSVRLAGPDAGDWAVLLTASTHIVWQLAVDPRVDVFLCIFIVGAVLALCIWIEERQAAAPLHLLAICLGAALGTKFTGLFIGVAILGVTGLLASWDRIAKRPSTTIRTIAISVVLLLVPNSSWYASNLFLHGDPLFPMLRGDYYELPGAAGVRIPTDGALDDVVHTVRDDSKFVIQAHALRDQLGDATPTHLFDFYDVLQNPDAYAVKPNHFASPLLGLFLFLPFAIPADPRKRLAAWALFAITGGCFVALASQANLLRYVLPIVPLMAAGGAIVIARFENRAWHALCLAMVFALFFSGFSAERHKLAQLHPEVYARSNADRITWLRRTGYNFTDAMPRMIARINSEIDAGRMSEDDLVLMVGEGKGRLLHCRYLPDLSWFLQRWVVELAQHHFDHDAVLRSLQEQGVTHILYNHNYYSWVIRKTTTPVKNLAYAMTQLEILLQRNTVEVFRMGGMRLHALPRARPAAPLD